MLKKKTLTCDVDRRYKVELDPAQVFPDDPGQGTPAMLYGPRGASATFYCAEDTGELTSQDGDSTEEIPHLVCIWLGDVYDDVDELIERATAEAKEAAIAAAKAESRAMWVRTLAVGAEVWWDDPSNEYTAGLFTVSGINAAGVNTEDTMVELSRPTGRKWTAPISALRDPKEGRPRGVVRFGSDGRPVVYEDETEASEHRLRMQEGLC